MTTPAWRPFVDPLDLFSGPGWLLFLPPLLFAAAFLYHALRCGEDLPWLPVLRRAAWTAGKALLVLGGLMLALRMT